MSDPGTPVTADAETTAVFVRDFETGESGRKLEDLARELGVTTPDGRDGWEIAYRYDPAGKPVGLVWAEPSSEDEDDEDLRPDDQLIAADGTVTRAGDVYNPAVRTIDEAHRNP